MKLLGFIFLIVFSFNLFAQGEDVKKIKKHGVTVSIMDYPFALFFNAVNYNVEASTIIKGNNSLHFGGGYIKSFKPIKNTGFVNLGIPTSQSTKGYRLHIEGRHYLNKHKLFEPAALLFWLNVFQYKSLKQENTGYYVAFQNKYQHTETIRDETILDFISNQPFPNTKHYKQNTYTASRNVMGGYLKFGYNAIKQSGFTVDHAIGIGFAHVSSTSKNKLGNDSSKDFPYNKVFDDDRGIFFDIAYSFKIGWSF